MAGTWAALIADLTPVSAVLFAAIPSAVTGGWVYWQWRAKRIDDRNSFELTREERRAKELDQQQASFGAEQSRWFSDLRTENRELRLELTETRRDRDRGWDLARWWHGAAHDVLRQFRGLRHDAMNMQQWIQSAVVTMRPYAGADGQPVLRMPESIPPVPDRLDLPMGLEDPK